MDTTPTKSKSSLLLKVSKIPSPTKFPSPKYYQYRSEDKENIKPDINTTSLPPAQLQLKFPHMSSDDLIQHTKSSLLEPSSKSLSSNLDGFYQENVKKLNDLQKELQEREQILQNLQNQRDELNKTLQEEIAEKVTTLKASVFDQKQIYDNVQSCSETLKLALEEKLKVLQESFLLEQEKLKSDHWSAKNEITEKYNTKKNLLTKECDDQQLQLSKELDKLHETKTSLQAQLETETAFTNEISSLKTKYTNLIKGYKDKHVEKVNAINLESENILAKCQENETDLETNLLPFESKLDSAIFALEENMSALKEDIKLKTNSNSALLDEYNSLENECQFMNKEFIEIQAAIDKTKKEISEIDEDLHVEENKRRALHNELQDLRGNIRVFCRIRPVNEPSFKLNISTNASNVGQEVLEVEGPLQKTSITGASDARIMQNDDLLFQFDKIFDENSKNTEVFEEVSQLVQSSLDGYNVCIFAYGQTGSGKTHTMLNPGDGIIPMTLKHIYEWIEKLSVYHWKYKLSIQFVEIYNETIVDLLAPNKSRDSKKIEIRHIGNKTTLTNTESQEIINKNELEKLLHKAIKSRSTAATNANNHSSRSHSIFTIKLEGSNGSTGESREGVLNLIDLAGSERLNSSMVTGDRLKETQYINKSLSCLGDVIHSLRNAKGKDSHIPFRNSKLTYLLQNYLIGEGKTLMFVNISGNSYNESLNSLRFASKVNNTKMKRKSL